MHRICKPHRAIGQNKSPFYFQYYEICGELFCMIVAGTSKSELNQRRNSSLECAAAWWGIPGGGISVLGSVHRHIIMFRGCWAV